MSQALNADQAALNVIANNVANASTPGYTKETPTWQENDPILINGVSTGTGATETGATSQRDRVLEERLNQQQQLASASGSRLTALDSIQALFTPDSGSASSTAGDIGSDLTGFFKSFSSLEANPTNSALRESVLSSASTLAVDISNAANSLNAQRSGLNQQAVGVVDQVNALATAIAQPSQHSRQQARHATAARHGIGDQVLNVQHADPPIGMHCTRDRGVRELVGRLTCCLPWRNSARPRWNLLAPAPTHAYPVVASV